MYLFSLVMTFLLFTNPWPAFADENANDSEVPEQQPNMDDEKQATTGTERDGESYRCALGNLTREVRIIYEDKLMQVPCRVEYDKEAEGGGVTSLWRAENSQGYCEEKITFFVNERLAPKGWECTKT